MSKNFNDAFRRALRPEPGQPPPDVNPEPATPAPFQSIDGGAGTGGDRTEIRRPSMNDLLRKASRDR